MTDMPSGVSGAPLKEPFQIEWISLRDYFAAQSMMGFIAENAISAIVRQHRLSDVSEALPILAEGCYQMADAMLKERAK